MSHISRCNDAITHQLHLLNLPPYDWNKLINAYRQLNPYHAYEYKEDLTHINFTQTPLITQELQPSSWLWDSCTVCEKSFGCFDNKYHCQKCGRFVHKQCAVNDVILKIDDEHATKVRVCRRCFTETKTAQHEFPAMIARHKWTPDKDETAVDGTRCQHMGCSTIFSFWCRRHHCRRCGHLICGACSGQKHPLMGSQGVEMVRVCNTCYDDLACIDMEETQKKLTIIQRIIFLQTLREALIQQDDLLVVWLQHNRRIAPAHIDIIFSASQTHSSVAWGWLLLHPVILKALPYYPDNWITLRIELLMRYYLYGDKPSAMLLRSLMSMADERIQKIIQKVFIITMQQFAECAPVDKRITDRFNTVRDNKFGSWVTDSTVEYWVARYNRSISPIDGPAHPPQYQDSNVIDIWMSSFASGSWVFNALREDSGYKHYNNELTSAIQHIFASQADGDDVLLGRLELAIKNNIDVYQLLCATCWFGGSFVIIEKILNYYASDINQPISDNNTTILHWACHSGQSEVVALLLQKFSDTIDLSIRDKQGRMPLHLACYKLNTEVVRLLLTRIPLLELVARPGDAPSPVHAIYSFYSSPRNDMEKSKAEQILQMMYPKLAALESEYADKKIVDLSEDKQTPISNLRSYMQELRSIFA